MKTALLNIARQYQGSLSPQRRVILNDLERTIGPDTLSTFAFQYRNALGKSPSINLVDAVNFFNSEPHQIQALEELQQKLSPTAWAAFEQAWLLTEDKGMDDRFYNLLKRYEGCELVAYPDPGTGGQPYTIGYGATFYENGSPVRPGDKITQARAEELLEFHIQKFRLEVEKLVKVAITPGMKGALISFHYNTGSLGSSTLLKLLNQGKYQDAANQFLRWVNGANGPLEGLISRRKAERELFLVDGIPGQAAAPESKALTFLVAHTKTLLKKEPVPGDKLKDTEVLEVPVKKQYSVEAFLAQENGHLKVKLGYNAGEWWIFPGHWAGIPEEITIGGKPVAVKPAAKGEIDLKVIHFTQRDNYRDASRTCFSSTCAMALKYFKPGAIKTDDEYVKVVFDYGDTIYPETHIKALAKFGLKAQFLATAQWRDIDKELEANRVVGAGFLHHGSVFNPTGGGHWALIKGRLANQDLKFNDPWGELDLVGGEYISTNGANVVYSRKNWGPRWLPYGPSSGYLMLFRP